MVDSLSTRHSTMNAALDEELRILEASGLKRSLRQVQQRRAGTVLLNGERVADYFIV